MKLLLRRTLVLVNGEWAMVNKSNSYIHHSQLIIDDPNAQVSDTTGDAIENKSW